MTTSTSSITTMHPDIIHTHILSRLDGATLATASSVSSHLRRLCTAEDLWRDICTATWPSLMDPTACHVISTIPTTYHSIFSDAFPSLHHLPNNPHRPSPPSPEDLISAVDIHYMGNPVFSRVRRTETKKNRFLSSPLWISMLEPDEVVPTPVKFLRKGEEWLKHLEENLSLSWIIIDPVTKRAANLSSRRAVSVARNWRTRDLEVVYAVEVAAAAQCVVKVTCCGKVGGELHVREVDMVMEDREGRHVTGKKGVGILQRAMESGGRKKVDGVEAKERFEKFARVVKERKHRREKARDVVSVVLAFIAFVLFCYLAGL